MGQNFAEYLTEASERTGSLLCAQRALFIDHFPFHPDCSQRLLAQGLLSACGAITWWLLDPFLNIVGLVAACLSNIVYWSGRREFPFINYTSGKYKPTDRLVLLSSNTENVIVLRITANFVQASSSFEPAEISDKFARCRYSSSFRVILIERSVTYSRLIAIQNCN